MLQLAEMVWILERRHYADPDKEGALPHVNTLATGPNGEMMGQMSDVEEPIVRDLVLVGAGHAHAFVIKMFGMRPEKNVRLTLITEGVDTPYSGMLPGFISGVYTREECHIDTIKLGEFAKVRIILGRAKKITDRSVILEDGQPEVPFDVCSVNVGSSPQLPEQGAHLVTPVKPISRFSLSLDRIVARDCGGESLRVAVIGAGAGGVELLLALYRRLSNAKEFVLIAKSDEIMPNHSPVVRKLMLNAIRLRKDKVKLRLATSAIKVEKPSLSSAKLLLHLWSSEKIQEEEEFDEIIWCTQACGQPLLRESEGFNVDDAGFVLIDDNLRVKGRKNVFAVGDCCHLVNNPCPKAGVFAVRMGMPLAANLRRLLRGEPESTLERYVPQRTFLGIIGTADGNAIASKGGMGLEGTWLWSLKDWIDKKWMSGYTSGLPTMKSVMQHSGLSPVALAAGPDIAEELCHAKMRCGGCGSKVGSSVLSRVLKGIEVQSRPEVVLGLDEPDDCALVQLSSLESTIAVQTVDYFRSFWRDEYVFGQIAANHALSDVHAMGSEPIAAMCIAQVPFGPGFKVEQRLTRLMRGACDYLNRMNCSLIGGHTCEGAELAMGFSILGRLGKSQEALKKGGMRAGDVIILTKPIGTGVIMAASMRVLAKGEWVQAALQSMLVSNRDAGLCLRAHKATACTDVTGFGLVGHLVEMIRASNREGQTAKIMCELDIDTIPWLSGAKEVVCEYNVLSSLQHENVRAAMMIENRSEASKSPIFPLLFDPQTAGGLLASIPQAKAAACLEELRDKYGYIHARCIGRVVQADSFEVIRINMDSASM